MPAADMVRFKMDEEWHDLPEGVDSFGDLREWVIEHFRSRGLVLLGALNGEVTVSQEEMDEWEQRPLSSFDTVEFLSADPGALARRTCDDMLSFLDRLADLGERTAEALDAGDNHRAGVGLKDCAEGWSLVFQSYRDLLRLSGTDPSTVEIDGRSLAAAVNDLRALLAKISKEFGRDRMGKIRDLLLTDLALYVEPMREGFEQIKAKFD